MSSWLCLVLEARRGREEQVMAELWSLGTNGIEESETSTATRFRAYFRGSGAGAGGDRLAAHPWHACGARVLAVEDVPERDWMALYRQETRPFPVGESFLVDPREPGAELVRPGRRRLLRLPARRAFGIGSHESTRLAVGCLEEMDLGGLEILDVGTGTGILALVALELGAASVVGVDIDVAAVWAARENQVLNHRFFRLVAGSVAALSARRQFDVAVANVLPVSVERELGAIAARVRRGGRAVFSGLAGADIERFARLLERTPLTIAERREDNGWRALICEKISL